MAPAGAFPPRPSGTPRGDSAAEEVLGILLLLAIFAISVAVLYAGGLPSLWSAQKGASLQQVEQAFTSLDSKLSKAALGESPSQTVAVDLAGGSLYLQNNTWMNVTLKDTNGNLIDCINVSLGTLEYLKEDRYVAWEGGGIWARYPDGGQAMLSSPEFHYDGTTMTLPIVRLNGTSSGSGSGTVRLTVNTTNVPTLHYPYSSNTGPCSGLSFAQSRRANPLTGGNITITVRSEYYQAWANFFNSSNVQSLVSATSNTSAKTATATLSVQPADKDHAPFTLPISITCINTTNCTHPVKSLTIYDMTRGQSSCGTIKVDLRTPSSNSGTCSTCSDGFHIYLQRTGGSGYQNVQMTVDWKNGSTKEQWGPVTIGQVDGSCSSPYDVSSTLPLLNYTHTDRTAYEPEDVSTTWGTACDLNTNPVWYPGQFTSSYLASYPPPYPPAGKSCYDGKNPISASCADGRSPVAVNTTPMGYVLAHYMAKHMSLWGAINFQCGGVSSDKCPGGSNSVGIDTDYSLAFSCGSAVTYLHISQDNLNATIG